MESRYEIEAKAEYKTIKDIKSRIGEGVIDLLSPKPSAISRYDLFLAHLLGGYIASRDVDIDTVIKTPEARQIVKSLKNIARVALE